MILRAISKLLNIVFSVIFAILLALTSFGAIFTYNLSNVVSDRQNLKDWFFEDEVKKSFVEYIIDNSFSMVIEPLSLIVSEEEIYNQIENEIIGEKYNKIVDGTVDKIYDWLEGDSNDVEIQLLDDDILGDLDFLDEMFDEKLGIFSKLINPSDILKISDQLNIINLDKLTLASIPHLYQSLLKLPQKLLIVSIVLALLIFFSHKSWRVGAFINGLAISILPIYILFLYKIIPLNKILEQFDFYNKLKLPDFSKVPEFIKLIYFQAENQVLSSVGQHAIYILIVGLLLIVVSQLAIKEREVEEEPKKVIVSTDSEDEEDEQE